MTWTPGSRRELADLVARHRWLADTRFLLVPYHLIGAESLEAAILGGYVTHVRELHPEAPLPAVYRAQGLIEDARTIRDRLGTEAFLTALPSAKSDGSWGELDTGWTADDLDAAFAAAPESELAQRLVNDVVPTFMPSPPRSSAPPPCPPPPGTCCSPTGPATRSAAPTRSARRSWRRPFGDLFDAVANGNDQPFTEKLKHQFDADALRAVDPATLAEPTVHDNALAGLKFSSALPPELARATLASRFADQPAAKQVLKEDRIIIHDDW